MKKTIFTALAVTAAALAQGAAATAATVDLGALVPGQTYSVDDFSTVTATYTPATDEPTRFVYYQSCSPFDIFTAADYAEATEVQGSYSTTGVNNIYTYNLINGTTYYLRIPFVWQGGSFAIETGESTLTMIGAIPELAAGEKFSVGDYSTMSVRFSGPVTVGAAFLRSGSQTVSVTPEVHQGTFVDVVVGPKLMQLYKSGTIADGSEVTLVLTDVADETGGKRYGDTGQVEVTYTVAAKPAEVVSKNFLFTAEGANTIDSYYFPGDTKALAVIEFDMPVSDDFDPNPTGSALEVEIAKGYIPMAQFKYGNEEDPDLVMYQEQVMGVVDGCRVSFDLSGVRRRKLDMLPGASEKQLDEQLGIYYKNMRSKDGQRVYTGSSSNFVGFWATYTINEINCSISSEFSPMEGSALEYGRELEIWVGDGSCIRFDGVEFAYTKDGAPATTLVPMADITEEVDPDDEASRIYTLRVPVLGADAESSITVSLKNLLCADGFDHSADIMAAYDAPAASGIGAITAEGAGSMEPADVYDLAGRRVLSRAGASQLRSLQSGIYIMGGKKIMKR